MTRDHLLVGLALAVLTLAGYFLFPGHTYLSSDTQIYLPILEHLRNPAVFSTDPIALRPHVSFTIYDEAALVLSRLTGAGFQTVLVGQQLLYRWLGLLGVVLMARRCGLNGPHSLLVAAVFGLGATITGPAVLSVEYEPVPRAYAVPLSLFALGLLAHGHWLGAGIAASLGFVYHPPTLCCFWAAYGLLFLTRRQDVPWRPLLIGAAPLAAGLLLLLLTRGDSPSGEPQPLFGRIPEDVERLQRLRAAYNWVSQWDPVWLWQYGFLWCVDLLAVWRLKAVLPPLLRWFAVVMPSVGLLSIPVSYLTLEMAKWMVIPQFQPARAVLYLTVFAVIFGCIAGIYAVMRGRALEGWAWLFLVFAIPVNARVLQLLSLDLAQPLILQRALLTLALAGITTGLLLAASKLPPLLPVSVALVAVLAYPAIPKFGAVQNYQQVDSPALQELIAWAQQQTKPNAVFLFADAGRGLYPGVFRALALRPLYVDWKSGGQVNYFPAYAREWWMRWQETMLTVRPAHEYASRGIDYVVLKASGKPSPETPVFANSAFLVYRVQR